MTTNKLKKLFLAASISNQYAMPPGLPYNMLPGPDMHHMPPFDLSAAYNPQMVGDFGLYKSSPPPSNGYL